MAKKHDELSKPGSPVLRNKKAHFNYHIEDTIECGLELVGAEVKSLRHGQGNLDEAYARLQGGQVFIINMHIGPYQNATEAAIDSRRSRRLLLHRREIERFLGRATAKGSTLIPMKLFWKRGYAKIDLAIATGKKQYDKREDIKKRDSVRDTQREMARRRRS